MKRFFYTSDCNTLGPKTQVSVLLVREHIPPENSDDVWDEDNVEDDEDKDRYAEDVAALPTKRGLGFNQKEKAI